MDDSCSVLPISKLEGNVFHHEISTTFIKFSVNRFFLFLFFSKHLVYRIRFRSSHSEVVCKHLQRATSLYDQSDRACNVSIILDN